jgi:hypothetical protein
MKPLLSRLDRPKKYLLFGLALSVGSLLTIISGMHHVNQSSTLISTLDKLQSNLLTLQEAMNKPTPHLNLNAVTQDIQQLSQQLEAVRAQNTNHLDEALHQTEISLANRLDKLQKMVRHLNTIQKPITYLPPRHLPFSVLSLDSIQHVPVASVTYDFKTLPIEKGDSLAGWRVVSMDYGTQRIEFENGKKEHVLVTHENIGVGTL